LNEERKNDEQLVRKSAWTVKVAVDEPWPTWIVTIFSWGILGRISNGLVAHCKWVTNLMLGHSI
jgi:hypothetical protein